MWLYPADGPRASRSKSTPKKAGKFTQRMFLNLPEFDGTKHEVAELDDDCLKKKPLCQVCKFNDARLYEEDGQEKRERKRAIHKCLTCKAQLCGLGCAGLLPAH